MVSVCHRRANLTIPHRVLLILSICRHRAKLIYERGCQEKQLPDGLRPPHRIVVEAVSPIFRYGRTFRQFKNGQCNTVTEFGN